MVPNSPCCFPVCFYDHVFELICHCHVMGVALQIYHQYPVGMIPLAVSHIEIRHQSGIDRSYLKSSNNIQGFYLLKLNQTPGFYWEEAFIRREAYISIFQTDQYE